MTTLAPWSQATYTGTVLVAVVAGDDLVAKGVLPAPTVIKLDVEGHEFPVLRGLANTLKRSTCEIVVFEDDADSYTPVKQFLSATGFTITPLTREEDSSHSLMNFTARKSRAARP